MTENRWLPVVGGVLMNLALGSLYAWSVFVIAARKGIRLDSAPQTSWVYTIAVVCFALTFIVAGRLQDRKGPKICAYAGGMLVSLGFFLASFTPRLLTLYLFFGVIVGVGNGFGYSAPTPVASKWFPDKRGLVVGLDGRRIRRRPGDLRPDRRTVTDPGVRLADDVPDPERRVPHHDDDRRDAAQESARRLSAGRTGHRRPRAAASRTDFTTREMLATPTFYFLWIAYALGTTAGQMTISQLVPFARTAGLGAGIVATLLVVDVGSAMPAGAFCRDWMSDTLGRLPTLRMMVLLSAFAMPALFLWRTELVPFFVLAAVVYWCYGTQLSVFASTTADFYGTKNLGLNYGAALHRLGAAGISAR